ncbi:MAG: SDR family oxidoreductase [Phycisphaeraceae bacterium]|nr:SDR family oxidoreductase [Phycisphaeraceae bacterium]MCW5753934.1 SDR family oxidoreductase [Phycisphaeraceae bacterium]
MTIALVTGANKGIGFETARQLAERGMTVLMGSRDRARGEQAAAMLREARLDVRVLGLDVTDAGSIGAAAKEIEQRFGVLDVLVNNAGIAAGGFEERPSTVAIAALRETFETNFFGLVAVTQAMLPLIRKSAAGRIVNLSSVLGSLGEHADPNSTIYGMLCMSYNASKAAVNMFTQNLAHELRGTGIKVNAAHPGWVQTDMGGPAAPLSAVEGAWTSVYLATLGEDGPSGGLYHTRVHMRW